MERRLLGAGPWRMPIAVVVIGVLTGVVGAALTLVLHLTQHVAFGYTEDTFLIGVERASALRRVIAPAAGGLLVALGWRWLRRRVDVERVSVTRAVRDPEGNLPLGPALADSVLQIVSVGAGASLGREGAPRQAGAAFARVIAGWFRFDVDRQRVLIACGAGAGLAAVYNVPLAGALFTVEVLLVSASWRLLVPAVVTAGLATVVAWPVLSMRPAYDVAPLHFSWPALWWAFLCGPLAGAGGVWFTRLMTLARKHAARGRYAVPVLVGGFGALGVLSVWFPQLLGNGKGAAELAFTGGLGLGLAAALTMLKPVATGGCLASGAIGGLMTPSLATGACLGAVAGHLWNLGGNDTSVGSFALVGAAAMLAVTQRAPITAAVLPLEMLATGLGLIGPIAIAVALATLTATLIDPRDQMFHGPQGQPTMVGVLVQWAETAGVLRCQARRP